jgi:hypothetical protein
MTFLEEVKSFLAQAQNEPVAIPKKILEEFKEDCGKAVQKQFTDSREKEFRIRMSNIGKPLCQLKMEKKYFNDDSLKNFENYNYKLRNLFGDILEAVVVMLLKSVKANIDSTQGNVKLDAEYFDIKGTYDIIIDDKVYDIKSASPFAFEKKFGEQGGGFEKFVEDDVFGYLSQGYLYSEATTKPFGGWIVVNKSTGELLVSSPPEDDEKFRQHALSTVKKNIKSLMDDEPFERCFDLIEESFYQKKTGNKVLGTVCSFCPYKHKCWGDNVQYLPQQQSKAKSPKYFWYVEINQPKETADETSTS